ncbi:hypothetical protein KR222_003491 [Zaprionus bogoriensis]|nr:hypothetical protein KR222_003491 [Zaprionus bogoriensis]
MHRRLVLLPLQLLLCATCNLADLSSPNHSDQVLSRLGIERVQFNSRGIRNGGMYYTNLERYRNLVLLIRNTTLNWQLARLDQMMARNRAEGKLQTEVSKHIPFPCDVRRGRSAVPPVDISRLRPGDIDIVAAMGDSVTAGNSLISESFFDVFCEFRGFSFSGGGIEDWRTALTLPNILKLYNPRLYGYAATHGMVVDTQKSVFNIAEPMVTLRDLPYQAEVLIERLRADPKVNMRRHWKLLTIFVGMNDNCFELCMWDDTEAFLRLQRQQMYRALRLLRQNVPRLLINWIMMPGVSDFKRIFRNFPSYCNANLVCSCLTSGLLPHYPAALQRLQRIQLELVALPEFRSKNFAIVPHTVLSNVSGMVFADGALDMQFFAHDCMHLSQRAHAVFASALWNSMLKPLDTSRAHSWRQPLRHLLCPSDQLPFLRTIG